MSSPRVRFAPSPTGYLHVGGARTALFNWLYARRHGGVFVLRIEDTDVERSSSEMVAGILDGMRWLGLDWDEGPEVGGPHGPYFQSERLDRYRAMADRARRAAATPTTATARPSDLKRQARRGEAGGDVWPVRPRVRRLPAERGGAARGGRRAARDPLPRAGGRHRVSTIWCTGRSSSTTRTSKTSSSSAPTATRPTTSRSSSTTSTWRSRDVVRGDDHISNTPKQVLLYQAFGAPVPRFAHVPLILGPDKKRLSKRHGATSVMEYERQGYLAEAMVNFLALLGWSPGDDRELFTRDELVARVLARRHQRRQRRVQPREARLVQRQHIMRLPAREVAARLEPLLREAGLWRDEYAVARRGWLDQAIELLKPRARKLEDFVERGRPFFQDRVEYDPAAVKKHLSAEGLAPRLQALREALAAADAFDPATTEATLRRVASEQGTGAGPLIHATRVGVTGVAVSPGLFEVLALLGRERTLARLDDLQQFLRSS